MLYLMNLKNETAKKVLCMAYSQGNNITYPTNIKSSARYLSTQYLNNKPTNERGGSKRNKKGDDPKYEDKDSDTDGTVGAIVEDTTTNEDTTAPSRGARLGAYVSETNQTLSRQSHMVDEILGAHPVNDTVISEEKMAGSHITKFHTYKDKQPVVEDPLSQVDQDYNNQHARQLMTCDVEDLLSQEDQDYNNRHNRQLMTCKHDTGQGYHNPSNPQSTKSVDCEVTTGKNELFSSEVVKNVNTTDIMDELAAMIRPPNPTESLIPKSTLQKISKRVMKKAVEDKKVEFKQSGTQIPTKDINMLLLIDTLDLYGLINDGINKYNDYNTV